MLAIFNPFSAKKEKRSKLHHFMVKMGQVLFWGRSSHSALEGFQNGKHPKISPSTGLDQL